MKVADVMSSPPVVISADATVREAARKMASSGVGMLPVEDDGVLVGVITDRDIATRAAARGGNAGRRKVREIMTSDMRYCFVDDDVMSATLMMEERQIRRLGVLDRYMGLVGVVSVKDLAVHAHGESRGCEVIQAVAQPALQHG